MSDVLAIIALAAAIAAILKLRTVEQRAETHAQRLYKTTAEIKNLREQLRSEVQRFERLIENVDSAGPIHRDMLIAEALAVEPTIAGVLASFKVGAGGCGSCSTSNHESIAEAARHYGADIDKVMKAIHQHLQNPGQPFPVQPGTVEREPQLLQIGGLGG